MEIGIRRDLQHIGLPTACATVYAAITGIHPDATDSAKMQAVLNDVARAMAYVIRIYADAKGWPQPISGLDVLQGTFTRGAHTFESKAGEEIRGLTVQRRDMMRAIEVLKSAKVRFRVPAAA